MFSGKLLAVTYFIHKFATELRTTPSMKYIVLPVSYTAVSQSFAGQGEASRRLSFYLAMEEFVARTIDETDCFFLWQVQPSVIFGRNQVMQNEVNVDYCREHGIEMYRRKSGGGCVYADEGNIMLSFITKSENVPYTFNRFIGMLLLVLRRMGLDAVGTAHNDVLLPPLSPSDSSPQAGAQWRKVSGTAYYHLPGASIVHATLLYDTNMEHMLNAITPSAEKLQSKGIESVRQRITLLKDYISLNLDELKTFIRQTLCDDELLLTPEDVAAIEKIEQEYLRTEFIQKL
jgi:lipoic acid synthetase/lipoate-protein ligase A